MQWAHSSDAVPTDKICVSSDYMEKEFGANRFGTIDIIALLRDSPNFAGWLFSGNSQQFSEVDTYLASYEEGNRRVGILFYDSLVEDKEGMDVSELMVWEPSPALVSMLSMADVEPYTSLAIRALSNGGVPFEQYTEAMHSLRYNPSIANSVICEYLSSELYREDADGNELPPVIPEEALTADGLVLWFYRVYMMNRMPLEVVNHDDIEAGVLLDYAAVGIFNAKTIRHCRSNGIDPSLASSMHSHI